MSGKKLVQLAKAPSAKSPAGANLQCGSYFEAYFYGDQEHLRSPGTVVTPDDKIAYMTEGGGWASVLRSNVIVIKAPGGKKMVPTVEESGTGDDRKAIVHVSPERHAERADACRISIMTTRACNRKDARPFFLRCALERNRPRVECSPSLASALGTASPKFSAENLGSGVRFLPRTQKRTKQKPLIAVFVRLCPREESNLYRLVRSEPFYPLNYEDVLKKGLGYSQ